MFDSSARVIDCSSVLQVHGFVDDQVQRAPVRSTERRGDGPASLCQEPVGDLAAIEDAEKLSCVMTGNPHGAFSIEAEPVRVAAFPEVGEHRPASSTTMTAPAG